MIATQLIRNALSDLLANDITTLAPVALVTKVHLIKAPFTPGAGTDFTALTEADFTGATAKGSVAGPQQSMNSPDNPGYRRAQIIEPVGGWTWIATAAPLVPQNIYGYVLTDNASAITYGSQVFTPPVIITGIGDAVVIPEVFFDIPVNGIL